MRWSEFAEKECIDLVNGERLGNFLHADLTFHPQTGKIESILIPVGSSWFKKKSRQIELSWRLVKKVGPEMVIISTAEQKG
ncbi:MULTISPECIES: YlmC/YmxH family sporulation protein [Thermoactinomyces]|jgi:YlmC/YmxH family sporulation protein|uniref:YlmC/YmxH family sporulation protein n=1 Tax=Thermoactinomyces daqus TaxID=1329516 RepID=A0A7W2AHL9_9BACL|nr:MULTISPECIES: YlmC/YmxH family sporulation protein [Thermoactinomyces]MBA4542295.1 YlmC/YmxH family sporulation protein [Thermoactinomyces daqus]MBH8598254.1 YlmC/YmxH family sporulation protein [Thermoactinomyces sp. CICC 10523]MBH8604377.1 YlmC/YmxH family sporulation protein [Thermoactinomyces sp. CICC 10522]MBH8608508.1 YlmC/YmxH family sporulation protein [Thermoactinomyces sp. CICC 10521]